METAIIGLSAEPKSYEFEEICSKLRVHKTPFKD